jgi:hypothetical protein
MPLYKHGRRHEAAVELRFRLITATSEKICSVSLRCEALAASGREHPLSPGGGTRSSSTARPAARGTRAQWMARLPPDRGRIRRPESGERSQDRPRLLAPERPRQTDDGAAVHDWKESQSRRPEHGQRLPVWTKTSSRLLAARFEQESCRRGQDCPSPEPYQQLGRVRRPQCRSAAIAGDGRLDALADPRLATGVWRIRREITDPLADDQDQPGRANDLAVPARARNRPEGAFAVAAGARSLSTWIAVPFSPLLAVARDRGKPRRAIEPAQRATALVADDSRPLP